MYDGEIHTCRQLSKKTDRVRRAIVIASDRDGLSQ